jgi:hypothetical protein
MADDDWEGRSTFEDDGTPEIGGAKAERLRERRGLVALSCGVSTGDLSGTTLEVSTDFLSLGRGRGGSAVDVRTKIVSDVEGAGGTDGGEGNLRIPPTQGLRRITQL